MLSQSSPLHPTKRHYEKNSLPFPRLFNSMTQTTTKQNSRHGKQCPPPAPQNQRPTLQAAHPSNAPSPSPNCPPSHPVTTNHSLPAIPPSTFDVVPALHQLLSRLLTNPIPPPTATGAQHPRQHIHGRAAARDPGPGHGRVVREDQVAEGEGRGQAASGCESDCGGAGGGD